ncbi:hypothetical protein RR42_m3110 [Cupriavidus basilensis]|uniref:Uncharacterized protein n=1 Tax=Cupriavidus basilensis TaxID=68895 RepID=A0A0C4YCA5_9BURK|nr:hypothetical protein RR42_m3110 [Cupriavidus basilensis]
MRARGLGGLHKGLLCGLSDLVLDARREMNLSKPTISQAI